MKSKGPYNDLVNAMTVAAIIGAPAKPALSPDEEIAALYAQDPGPDPVAREEYGRRITDAYRRKYGSQKLKSW